MRTLIAILIAAVPLSAGTVVDRVAVIVGRDVITEHQIETEIRARALVEREPLVFHVAAKRAAAERLVDRILIRRELEVLMLAGEELTQLAAFLTAKNQDFFGKDANLAQILNQAGLTREDWRAYLTDMFFASRLVELRFRPAVQVSEEDLEDFYEIEFLPYWRKRYNEPPPSIAERRDFIEQFMIGVRVNQALDRWLNQARIQTRIRYVNEVFQ